MEGGTLYVTISSSGGLRVDSTLSFLDLFLRSSLQENQTIYFGAASAISSLEIIEVSIVGKHFLFIKTSLKIMT